MHALILSAEYCLHLLRVSAFCCLGRNFQSLRGKSCDRPFSRMIISPSLMSPGCASVLVSIISSINFLSNSGTVQYVVWSSSLLSLVVSYLSVSSLSLLLLLLLLRLLLLLFSVSLLLSTKLFWLEESGLGMEVFGSVLLGLKNFLTFPRSSSSSHSIITVAVGPKLSAADSPVHSW